MLHRAESTSLFLVAKIIIKLAKIFNKLAHRNREYMELVLQDFVDADSIGAWRACSDESWVTGCA